MENFENLFFPKILRKIYSPDLTDYTIEGIVTFTDISGFTQLSENLMSEGYEGAEKIRDIIQYYFRNFTDIIDNFNGDILNYSGDAILAYFPNLNAGLKSFENMVEFTKKEGNVLSIRAGVADGEIKIHLFENNGGIIPLFYGETIRSALEEEKKAKIFEYSLKQTNNIDEKIKNDVEKNLKLDSDVKKLFIEKEKNFGSFSYVSVLFIYTQDLETTEKILKLNYGRIHINKIEQYEDGIRLMCVSGIPFAKSSPSLIMGDFIFDILKSEFKESVKGGATSGYIFNGFSDGTKRLEYNLIGKTINRAARISTEADFGEILIDKNIMEDNRFLEVEFKKNSNLKGIGKINLYIPKNYNKNRVPLYNPYYDRNSYLEEVENILKEKDLLIIGGEEGTGKTHLVSSHIFKNNLSAEYFQFNYLEGEKNILLKNFSQIKIDEDIQKDLGIQIFKESLKNSDYDIFIFDNCEYLDSNSLELIENLKTTNFSKKVIFLFNKKIGDLILDFPEKEELFELLFIRTGIKPSRKVVEHLFDLTKGNIFLITTIFKELVEKGKITINFFGEWDFSSDTDVVSKDISSISQIMFSDLKQNQFDFLKYLSFFEKPIKIKDFLGIFKKLDENSINDLIERNFIEKNSDIITFKNKILKSHLYHSIPLKERKNTHKTIGEFYLKIGENFEAGLHFYKSNDYQKAFGLLSSVKEIPPFKLNYSHIVYFKTLNSLKKDPEIIKTIFYILLKEGRIDEIKEVLKENKKLLDEDTYRYFMLEIFFKEGKFENIKEEFSSFDIEKVKDSKTRTKILDLITYVMVLRNDEKAKEYIGKTLTEYQNMDLETKVSLRLPSTLIQIGDYENSEKIFKDIANEYFKKNDRLNGYSTLVKMFFLFPLGKYNILEAIDIGKKYLKEMENLNLPLEKFRVLHSIATNLREFGQIDDSLSFELEALKLAELLNLSSERAIIYIILGRIFFNKGDIEKSIDYYNKGMEIAQVSKSNLLLETITGNLGVCYHVLKDYKNAYDFYEKALDLSIKVPYSNTRFIWILNLALLSTENRDFETAKTYIDMAKEEIKKNKLEERWIDVYQIEGNCYFLQGEYKKCLEVLRPVLDESLKKNLLEIHYESLPYYAGSLVLTGKIEEGKKLLEKVKDWLKDKDYKNIEDNLNEVLERIEKK
ncbi:MAG: hypothetical protein ABIN39_05925 [candidate division WOR-3 bacterium]